MQFKNFSLKTKFFVAVALVGVITFGVLVYLKFTHQLTPGPLSDVHPKGVSLGGVSSHAELETKCTHCHAPIHCITDTRCQDCHIEIAKDRLDTNTLHGRLPGVSRCQNCHTEHNGSDAELTAIAYTNIDHYLLAGFSLDLHQEDYDGSDFGCNTCHLVEGNIIETIDCVSCHSKNDHDYLAAHIETYGFACADCHDGKDRMANGVNHAQFYDLSGGHENLLCADCHQNERYVGLTQTCSSCHEEPELHAGVFGTNCVLCHSEVAWAPAELKQHTFLIQHGEEDEIQSCESCHAGTYTEYPCGSCHEDKDMKLAHTDVDSKDISDCISCHPTGRGSTLTTQQNQNFNTISGSNNSGLPMSEDAGNVSGSEPEQNRNQAEGENAQKQD